MRQQEEAAANSEEGPPRSTLNPEQEARIREEVRRQIEAADSKRREEESKRRRAELLFQEEQARRRIMSEEARAYYQNSPDYFEYVNENGDTEWLTRKQILAREGYFDYEENVENPMEGRRGIWLRLGAWLALVCIGLALILWYLWDDHCEVLVLSNIPGARILVDGQDTGQTTDSRITLSPGEHLVELMRPGYLPADNGILVLKLEPREEREVHIRLRPIQ